MLVSEINKAEKKLLILSLDLLLCYFALLLQNSIHVPDVNIIYSKRGKHSQLGTIESHVFSEGA